MAAEPLRIALSALAQGRPAKLMRGETPIVVIRDGDRVHALAGTCPHAGAPLEKGAVCEGRLICPWHKAAFSLDGAVLVPPALEPLARYEVRIEGGDAVVGEAIPRPRPVAAPGGAAPDTIAIIGAGAAAAGALARLDAEAYAGRVVLIGREDAPPYDRTVLSKMVVAGKMEPKAKALLPDRAAGVAVERIIGEAVRLDAASRIVELADGRRVAYDRALVAPGSAARIPDLPGIRLAGVHVLRSVADAASLVDGIGRARRALVVGAGFIGLEVASGLRERDAAVTVVHDGTPPLAGALGERIGRRIQAMHEAHGVGFRTGEIRALEGTSRIERAILADGSAIACDLVVIGIGAEPLGGFVDRSPSGNASVENGVIAVDATLRAATDLYAAGDVARFPYRGRAVRIEHFGLAEAHGWHAAGNLLGDEEAFTSVPFFWTAQHGNRLDVAGYAETFDDVVIEGDLDALDFVAFVVENGNVAAAIGCKRDTAMARITDALRGALTVEHALALLDDAARD